jgi:ABC-2 type transport system permease protein
MLLAAIKKDAQLLLRDRGALISLFLLPVIFIVVFGSIFKFGPEQGTARPIALWHPAGDLRGLAIARALAASGAFAPRPAPSAEAVRAAVAGGDAVAGLIVPAGLSGPAPIELAIDLGAPIQVRGPIEGALEGLITEALAPPAPPGAPPPPVIEVRSPPGVGNPLDHASAFQVTVPGNAVLFGFYIALTVAMSFSGERRAGTWRRLLAAPVRRSTALLATLVPYYLVGLCQLAFLFGIGILAFGMEVAGSPLALVALSMMVVLCAVGLGLAFAALGGSEKQLGGIGSVVLLVMGLLGGCMVPRLVMPQVMQTLGKIVPHAWALDGYFAVLVRRDTGVLDVLPQLGALGGFALLFAGFGVWRFKFER